MRPFRSIITLAGAALLLSTFPAAAHSPTPGDSSPPAVSIEGRDWRLTRARLSGAYGAIPAEVTATLRLEGGNATGSGGCNSFSGSYALDGARISFARIVSTMMACGEPAMTIEGFYLADLGGVSGYVVEGSTLRLVDATGDDVLAFEAVTPGVTGRVWMLRGVVMGGVLTDVPADVIATLRLIDGQASGTGGCNTFGGSYTIDGDTLTFGALASTEMACGDPQSGVESAYLEALSKVATFATDGTSLHLFDAAGTELLRFDAQPDTVIGSWSVTGLGDGAGAVSSLLAGSQLSAVFGADGSLTGSSGCNDFAGTYTVTGIAIAIDALITTKRACVNTGLGDQETAYIGALRATASYAFANGSLELLAANGELLVALSPIATVIPAG